MAHGLPDSSNVKSTIATYNLQDLAEHAARLGSPVLWDRRGQLVWMDDFRHGIGAWLVTRTNANLDAYPSATYWESGGASCMLQPLTVTPNSVGLLKSFPYGLTDLTSVFVNVSWPLGSDTFKLYLDVYDGTNRNRMAVQYNGADDSVTVLDSDGSYATVVETVGMMYVPTSFNKIRLEVSLEDLVYRTLELNQVGYDLSAYSAYATASATNKQTQVGLVITADDSTNLLHYIDSVVIAQHEET